MEEVWKQISGADKYYEVSNYGRARVKEHKDKNENIIQEKILAPIKTNLGYVQYGIMFSGERKRKYAHRLVAEAFIPNPLNLAEVDHIDDIRDHNNAENLQWITRQDNIRKMADKKLEASKHKRMCSCGKEKSDTKALICFECRKRIRRANIPNKDELINVLSDNRVNLSAVGRIYSVSDNAVRKWCKLYQIDICELKGLVA